LRYPIAIAVLQQGPGQGFGDDLFEEIDKKLDAGHDIPADTNCDLVMPT
jgi:hypothetical protein